MKQKIIITTVIILIIAAVIFSAGCINSKPTYKAGFDTAHSPYTWTDVNDKKTGLDYEALMWIAQNQGFNVEFVDVPISDFNKYLEDGSIDMFYSGVTVTDARKKLADYTIDYLDSNLIAIAKKGSGVTINDVLSGNVKVSGLTGSVGLKWFENLVGSEKYQKMIDNKEIITRITFQGALQDVEIGVADVAITNDVTAETHLKERPHLMCIGILEKDTSKAVAVKKGNTELLNIMNAGLENLKASKQWSELLHKYEIPAKQSVYKVGIDDTHSPYSYKDENGNLIGFDVEAIQWIADKYGFEIEFVNLPWTKIISAVADGTVDMSYTGITITKDREKKVTFSEPCYSVGMAVAKLKSNPVTMLDFTGQKAVIGVKGGTTPEEWIQSYFGKSEYEEMISDGRITLYDTTPDVIKALESGAVDVIVMTDLTMNTQIKDKSNIELMQTYGGVEELGVAFGNGNIALQYIINDGLKALKSSGKYDELQNKYDML
ncbi:MAG: ABC transporter substrate-binding protein [Methanocorpusculum sp.]|nr:ABC transporter substrate-binding protein [Methanocorpusculum sp.]